MLKQIKRISMEDYNHLAIVFTQNDLDIYGIKENDKLDLDLLEQEITKNGNWFNNNYTKWFKKYV